MANLTALAQEFSVSLAELTETPEMPRGEKSSRENLRLSLSPILAVLLALALLFAVGVLFLARLRPDVSSPAALPPELELENLPDAGSDADAPDNISRFPMKNGEPDFSLREEPEQEPLSDTRRVYIAFNQLVTNDNLTAEEQYACRRDIFTLLPDMDWSELGKMGTAEYPDDAIFALLDWLQRQEAYTASEIFWIQAGCTAEGMDGAYAEAYDGLLSHALFHDPAAYVRGLAREYDGSGEWQFHAVLGAAFDSAWYPQELAAARETLNDSLSGGIFSPEEAGWCRLLLLYLDAAEQDDFVGLPHSPSELPELSWKTPRLSAGRSSV